jgi:hypothetical protein
MRRHCEMNSASRNGFFLGTQQKDKFKWLLCLSLNLLYTLGRLRFGENLMLTLGGEGGSMRIMQCNVQFGYQTWGGRVP